MASARVGIRHTVSVLATLAAAACGGNRDTTPDGPAAPSDARAIDAVPAPPDAMPRTFALASTGAQIRLVGGLQLYDVDLATDVDAVSVHQDFYGIPWDEFGSGAPLPTAWTAAMDDLATRAHALGKPIFLSLAIVQGPGRHYLADRASTASDGSLELTSAWSAECYDFATAPDRATRRAAYLAYVDWMIAKFDPTWINVAVEVNLFDAGCSQAWDGLVDVERAAYERAKLDKPSVIAFPSIQIDFLYGYDACPSPMTPDQCFDANYARLARLERDRFAISTYPYLISGFADVASLPADWLTRGAARGGEPLAIAETGWLGTDAIGTLDGTCVTAIAEDPVAQAAYFDRVIAAATATGSDLVTWWSNRDVVPTPFMNQCPCTFDASWCGLIDQIRAQAGSDPSAQFYAEMSLKIFGTMGLRTYDGDPRNTFYERWQALRARPIVPR